MSARPPGEDIEKTFSEYRMPRLLGRTHFEGLHVIHVNRSTSAKKKGPQPLFLPLLELMCVPSLTGLYDVFLVLPSDFGPHVLTQPGAQDLVLAEAQQGLEHPGAQASDFSADLAAPIGLMQEALHAWSP